MLSALQWFEQTDLYWEDESTVKKCLLVPQFWKQFPGGKSKAVIGRTYENNPKYIGASHISFNVYAHILSCFDLFYRRARGKVYIVRVVG
jgi:hypothetical protein